MSGWQVILRTDSGARFGFEVDAESAPAAVEQARALCVDGANATVVRVTPFAPFTPEFAPDRAA